MRHANAREHTASTSARGARSARTASGPHSVALLALLEAPPAVLPLAPPSLSRAREPPRSTGSGANTTLRGRLLLRGLASSIRRGGGKKLRRG